MYLLMKNKFKSLLLVFLLLSIPIGFTVWFLFARSENDVIIGECSKASADTVQAKRLSPMEIEPVEYDGICYKPYYRSTFPEELSKDMDPTGMSVGILAYYSCRTNDGEYCGRHISETEHYRIYYDQGLETDVQDVLITELKIKNGKLLMKNEAGESFSQELITRDE